MEKGELRSKKLRLEARPTLPAGESEEAPDGVVSWPALGGPGTTAIWSSGIPSISGTGFLPRFVVRLALGLESVLFLFLFFF